MEVNVKKVGSPLLWATMGTLLIMAGCSATGGHKGEDDVPALDTANDAAQDAAGDSSTTDTPPADAPLADAPKDSSGAGCSPRPTEVPVAGFFTDISDESGIRLNNHYPGQAQPINDHSRLGFVDLNGDGVDDIVMHSLFPNPAAGIPFEHLIFLGNGDGTFTDFSEASGLRDVQAGFFAFGDVDNDGDQDCFAGLDIDYTYFMPGGAGLAGHTHQVLLNDGEGHFQKVASSGLENVPLWVANAVFADFDGDANLDLFFGLGQTSAGVNDFLYFGKGDGTFVPATVAQFSDPNMRLSNGVVTCDYDNDGDMDIFVSTYSVSTLYGHNHLWENDGGTFKNVAVARGFAAQAGGNTWLGLLDTPEPGKGPSNYIGSNGFGIACGDVTNDGLPDIFLATISHPVAADYNRKWSDPTHLLVNQGEAGAFSFINETSLRQLPFNEGDIDASIIDFDNDGLPDLALSRENKYEKSYPEDAQKGWFGLLRQKVEGTFADMGTLSGINDLGATIKASLTGCSADAQCPGGEVCLKDKCRTPCALDSDCGTPTEICHSGGFCRLLLPAKRAQNHAWADVDSDGDLDLLIGGRDMGGGRTNFLFRNDIGQKNRWVAFRVEGDGQNINRDGVGTRVSFKFADRTLSREVHLSRGTYNSMDTKVLTFGLGDLGCDYTVEVRWPDGTKANFEPEQIYEGQVMKLTYPDTLSL